MFTHFEYTDGSNPYIAFTEEKAQEIISKWEKRGAKVERLKDGFYKIHNTFDIDDYFRIVITY